MSRVDKYIPFAFEAINNVSVGGDRFINGDAIPKVFKGYISSLGANIIQAGVKTAIYFYEAKESGSSGNKQLVTSAIYYILQKAGGVVDPVQGKLSSMFGNDTNLEPLAAKIMDAATALKLAIRTYKMN